MFASNYSTLRSFRGGQDGGTKLTRKNVTSNVNTIASRGRNGCDLRLVIHQHGRWGSVLVIFGKEILLLERHTGCLYPKLNSFTGQSQSVKKSHGLTITLPFQLFLPLVGLSSPDNFIDIFQGPYLMVNHGIGGEETIV